MKLVLLIALGALFAFTPRSTSSAEQPPGLIAFESDRDGSAGVWTMYPNGSSPQKLSDGGTSYGVDWSPDGRKLVMTKPSPDGSNFEIAVVDLSTREETYLASHPGFDVAPAWSPDGNLIAFVSDRHGGGLFELYVMDADGRNVRRLTQSGVGPQAPTWSPDSEWLAFQREDRPFGSSEIYSIRSDGSGETNLTQSPWFEGDPAWSPDGSTIAFTSIRPDNDGRPGLYLMASDGSEQRLLLGGAHQAEWSPAGDFLVYSREAVETNSPDIFIARSDGTDERNLTFHEAFDQNPAWQPYPALMTPPSPVMAVWPMMAA